MIECKCAFGQKHVVFVCFTTSIGELKYMNKQFLWALRVKYADTPFEKIFFSRYFVCRCVASKVAVFTCCSLALFRSARSTIVSLHFLSRSYDDIGYIFEVFTLISINFDPNLNQIRQTLTRVSNLAST